MSILSNQTGADYLKHYRDSPHDSILYVDSDERVSNNTNDASYTSSEIIRQEVSRIGVKKFHVRYNVPTINPRNSIVTFFTPASGTNHSVTITEGWYSPGSLVTELIIRLNSVSGASLCTFSAVGGNSIYTITGTVPFQFLSSTNVDRGVSSTGLKVMDAPATTLRIHVKSFYTSYLDFCVPALKEGQTRANTFTKFTRFPNSEHLFRVHVNTERLVYDNIVIDREVQNINFNKIRQRKLSTLEIQVYDEFGELCYDTDVQYISYALELLLLS